MAKSFTTIPPNMDDKEALKRFLTSVTTKLDGMSSLTSNPSQGAIADLKIDDENLKDIESKINQILQALRKSNIISG